MPLSWVNGRELAFLTTDQHRACQLHYAPIPGLRSYLRNRVSTAKRLAASTSIVCPCRRPRNNTAGFRYGPATAAAALKTTGTGCLRRCAGFPVKLTVGRHRKSRTEILDLPDFFFGSRGD